MAAHRLDHLELVAAGVDHLVAVGGKAEAMRHALGEDHAPFRPRNDGIRREFGELLGCRLGIAEVAEVLVIGRRIETFPDVGGDRRLRLQMNTLDAAVAKFADKVAASRIAVDDNDAVGPVGMRPKSWPGVDEFNIAELKVHGTSLQSI